MRYQNAVSVDEVVFKNFKSFIKHKKPDDEIFDELTVRMLMNGPNDYRQVLSIIT